MTAGIAGEDSDPSLRHYRIALVQTIVVHEIDRGVRPHRMVCVIGKDHVPARRELMLMETTPVKSRISAPMPGHVAWATFKRLYSRSLELRKQKIKKSSMHDARKPDPQQGDRKAATKANNSHGKIHKTGVLGQLM